MKKISLFLIMLLGVSVFCGKSAAQDAFRSYTRSFGFEPLRKSQYFMQDGQLRLSLYGPDKASSGKFVIPSDLLFRYAYTDSNSVIGQMEPLVMARPQDFDYVSEICLKAQADCRAQYKMWKGSTIGTFFLTLVNPVAGLAVAIPASLTPPRMENLGLSDVDMLQEGIYFHTYREEARKLKSKRAWTAYGIGLGIHVGAIFGLMAAFGH